MATDPLNKIFRCTSLDVDAVREKYHSAQPFPYIVIDRVFSEDWLDRGLSEWPTDMQSGWGKLEKGVFSSLKRGAFDCENAPGTLRLMLQFLAGDGFTAFLRHVTGIEDLFADKHFRGAGLHETFPGGFLKRHIDFNRLCESGKTTPTPGDPYRRVNVFLYLNPDWEPGWGGELCLWRDKDTPLPEARIAPKMNRLVITEASERSWHGHESPLAFPDGKSRRSLACYYYSRRPGDSFKKRHSTVYVKPTKKTTKQKNPGRENPDPDHG